VAAPGREDLLISLAAELEAIHGFDAVGASGPAASGQS
jgi:hypothetical protein